MHGDVAVQVTIRTRREHELAENPSTPAEAVPPAPERKASFLLATAMSESAVQVVREVLVERFPDHDPKDQRALQIPRTLHDRGYAACRDRGKHCPQNEFLGAGRMKHDRRHQHDPIRSQGAERERPGVRSSTS